MDLNELLSRHQAALITLGYGPSDTARNAAAKSADELARAIKQLRSAQATKPAVLSSSTFQTLYANPI